jgi:hypothetical protein
MPRCTPHTKADFLNLNDRLYEVLGSLTNREPFRLLERELNGMKGRIFRLQKNGARTNPVDPTDMSDYINESINTGQNEDQWLEPIRRVSYTRPNLTTSPTLCCVFFLLYFLFQFHLYLYSGFLRLPVSNDPMCGQVIAVYRYMLDSEVQPAIQTARMRLRVQVRAVSRRVNALRNLLSVFDEFDVDYWSSAATWARTWTENHIVLATRRFRDAVNANPLNPPANAQRVFNELQLLEDELDYIKTFPPAPPPP